jgi:TRAP-type C4-dicarboxylate transport system permease small subunit
VRSIIDRILVSILIVLMSVMVISTLMQVFARLINLNIPFTEELTIYAMMWVTMFGSAYTFGLRKQIAIDALQAALSESNKWKLEVLVEIIVAIFAILVLLVGGIRFVYVTFKLGQVSSVMQIAKGWIYIVLPISGLLILLYNFLNIKEIIRNHK